VAGTDALTTGTGGQVAQSTTYYNNQVIGDAALGAAVSSSSPATLTAATSITAVGALSSSDLTEV
jgi:hypothetical protein